MKVAITGGTGFVGSHLAKSLAEKGHTSVLIARGLDKRNEAELRAQGAVPVAIGTADADKLADAFKGCDAVAHCAGINREIRPGDYDRIHVEGTRNVVDACKKAGVKKIALVSFYTARPNCGSRYHESKYAAEEIVRASGLDYTILKAGMIYGKGDHMLDHLSHVFYTLPLFALVGFRKRQAAPLAIDDFVRVLEVSLIEGRLSNQTIAIVGPEMMPLEEAVRRVAVVVGKVPLMFPMPVFFHYALSKVLEATMVIPLVSIAQVRILTEGFEAPYGQCDSLPEDLRPRIGFSQDQIRKGLPEPGPFTLHDLRFSSTGAS
jgi:uncharacterized protein YbjT (DUF2867 family)